ADTIVLSADTIGVQQDQYEPNNIILSKPADAHEAFQMLRRLRERPHTVYTAFRLLKIAEDRPNELAHMTYIDHLEATEVTMRDYTDDEIEAYIASGDPFDKAGGYAIQNRAFRPVLQIDGCYNNVVGLPLCAVKRALNEYGVWGLGASDVCDCPRYIESDAL
ncbi:MAG: Maf family protein, partial [Armatimonadetes bacterium]|nr:Maf family protein [Anaerolineae bacterium]